MRQILEKPLFLMGGMKS